MVDSHHGPWAGRDYLIEQDAMLVKGVLYVRGVLRLTPDELRFEPIRFIDKLAGANDLAIPLAELSALDGGSQQLLVVHKGQQLLFRGRGAGHVRARLRALLPGLDPSDREDPSFDDGEKVLVQGELEAYVNNLLSSRGTVTLTDRRFRFLPDGFLNRIVGENLEVDVMLAEITGVEIVAVRRLLRIELGERHQLFAGYLVPRLYAQLAAMGVGVDGSAASTDGQRQILGTWKLSLLKGPLAQPGLLVVGADRLTFTPEGRLDAIVGAQTTEIALADVRKISMGGWPEARITVSAGDNEFMFALNDAEERMKDLMSLLLHFRDENEPHDSGPLGWLGEQAEEALGSVAPKLPMDADEEVLLLGPSLQWVGEWTVRRGWILVTTQRVLFIPGAKGDAPQSAKITSLRRVPFGEELTAQLQFVAKRRHLRFSPRGGDLFTGRFWASVEEVVGPVDEPDPDKPQPGASESSSITLEFLPRNLGPVKYVAIERDHRVVARIAPAETLRQPDGLGIFYPGLPSSELEEGAEVLVEIGRDDGVYRFDSTIVRLDDSPQHGMQPSAPQAIAEGDADAAAVSAVGGVALHVVREDQFLLVVQYPDDLRFVNRRGAFRVAFQLMSRARFLEPDENGDLVATGDFFRCTLEDLALIGCSILATRDIELNSIVELEFPLPDEPLLVRAQCSRVEPPPVSGGATRYGFKFLGLTIAEQDRVHLALTVRQRESLPLRA
ncbi:MAG TPA: hypothetical protein DIU15_07425 [Deltaproteobacteria bacterium]|nr:hypothetical protein [Deltaproteobacteria bacterium]HCP45855.1 hypothetical protein [Deltaproteobacteria bacterium]